MLGEEEKIEVKHAIARFLHAVPLVRGVARGRRGQVRADCPLPWPGTQNLEVNLGEISNKNRENQEKNGTNIGRNLGNIGKLAPANGKGWIRPCL